VIGDQEHMNLNPLREAQFSFNSDFTAENSGLSAKNTYFWRDKSLILIR
jgi:hypothetical protein